MGFPYPFLPDALKPTLPANRENNQPFATVVTVVTFVDTMDGKQWQVIGLDFSQYRS
jgi:hypothetical protein